MQFIFVEMNFQKIIRAIRLSCIAVSVSVLLGCTGAVTPTILETVPVSAESINSEPTASATLPTIQPQVAFGYTHQRSDGNRLVAGRGSLPNVSPIDIPLDFVPQWVVGAPLDDGVLWVAVLIDGQVQAFKVADGRVEPVAITPDRVPGGMPPLLRVENGNVRLVMPPEGSGASQATHPVILSSGQMAFVESEGDLVIWDDGEVARFPVNALPDARLLVDEMDRILLLTDRTTRYDHGVLGDPLEAGSITLVETSPAPRVALTIPIPESSAVEGIAPIWADINGDGNREIIVTVSNLDEGARVVLFDESGQHIGEGPPVGQGYRWRHQLVVAPFGPAAEVELAEVITPHLGSDAQFFALNGKNLELTAKVNGYTSHVMGSGNLDMAVAGDFNGDGKTELVLPFVRTRFELGGLQRSENGVEVVWKLPIGGSLITNLAAVSLPDGGLALGAGHDGQVLRVWQ